MEYKICNRCVMDTSDPNIIFDEQGYCNHCTFALDRRNVEVTIGEDGKEKYKEMIKKLKDNGKDKKYDCILGISGGIDSSYLTYLLSKENLRILGVHIDAGWNTDISNKNIQILKEKCNINLKIIKIDESEMMDLQKAYFLSEVINQDVPQDHAFFAKLFKLTHEHKMEYFISGHNWASESITPISWGYDAYDSDNIKAIHKKYGTVKLKDYPLLSFYDSKIKYPYIYKLKKLRPLNLIEYNPDKALEELKNEIGFLDYGTKHCESIFTRLYQSYIQPKKFGFEKRRAHLSSLIVSGNVSREEALQIMSLPVCKPEQIEKDIKEFIKKIGISRELFDEIISKKGAVSHKKFKSNQIKEKMFNNVKKIFGK